MGKVGLIQDFAKIAAGEVIERPASVVKELVENSMDAGAIHITITIEGAGKNLIQITDDGTGIDPEDVNVIFQHHYSSKIHTADELENVQTLGFRGEALASIAAVSQVELITRTKEHPNGIKLIINGGKRESLEQCGAPTGTSIKIKNIFFNLPVRRKFLHADRVELGHISDVISRYALAYPQIHFKLIHNEVTLINSPEWTNSEKNQIDLLSMLPRSQDHIPMVAYGHAIQNIYGKKVAEQMLPIEFFDEELHVYGYFGKPETARSERSAASLFVNKRLVNNTSITEIMENSFRDYIMRQKYPFFVLFIDLPPNRVDFNVHPSKRMVKFLDESRFMEKLQLIMDEIIRSQFKQNLNAQKPEKEQNTKINIENPIDSWQSSPSTKKIPDRPTEIPEDVLAEHPLPMRKPRPGPEKHSAMRINEVVANPEMKNALFHPEREALKKVPQSKYQTRFNVESDHHKEVSTKDPLDLDSSIIATKHLPPLKFLNTVGQVGDTYLIFQNEEGIIIIDQHAADERVNYERVQHYFNQEKVPIQQLIVPIKFDVGQNEVEFVKATLTELVEYGFTVEHFGGTTFLIRAIPAFIQTKDHPTLIADMCVEILHMGQAQSIKLIKREIIQYIACHKSVRAGEEIWNREKIRKLILDLDSMENPNHCAHGRPTYISFTFGELEKMFHRKL